MDRQYVLREIERLIAGYRKEMKLLAADGRNCDIVIGKKLGAADLREVIQSHERMAGNTEPLLRKYL